MSDKPSVQMSHTDSVLAECAAAQSAVFTPERPAVLRRNAKEYDLTPQECDVLLWLSKGKRYEQVAELMTISPSAVKMTVKRLLDKLGANTTAGAVAIAMRRKVIT